MNDLDRVKKALEKLIEHEEKRFATLEKIPNNRFNKELDINEKHKIVGHIQGLYDAIIIVNRAIIGESELIQSKWVKGIL